MQWELALGSTSEREKKKLKSEKIKRHQAGTGGVWLKAELWPSRHERHFGGEGGRITRYP